MTLRTRILTATGLAGALVLLAVGTAHSQQREGHGGFGGGRGHHGEHLAKFVLHSLDLTADQETQIEALVADRQETAGTQHEAMKTARQALHQLVLSGTFTDEAAEPHVQAIATASGQFARLHAKLGSEIYNLLTTEQREEFTETLAKVEEHHGRR
jgi:Spy/CpxP family protein refolding chaperone